MREDLVENGLKFLQHPSVQSTPLSERVSFLEGKGMTKEEIQAAIDRHQKSGAAAEGTQLPENPMHRQGGTAPGMMTTAAVPMQQMMSPSAHYPAYVRVLWTVSSLIGAASIVTFIWNYAVGLGYIPWLRPTPLLLEAEAVQTEKEKEAEKDEALLAELSSVAVAIQEQTRELAKLTVSLDEKERSLQNKTLLNAHVNSTLREHGNAQSIAELKAEVSTLKALLLAKRTKSTSDLDTNVDETSEDTSRESVLAAEATTRLTPVVDRRQQQQQPAVVSQAVRKAELMQNALKKLRMENSLEQLKSAAGILSMYVKNLVENPDVPRYRRIAPGNANFKQKIEPLKHHGELLKSIGFETVGLNLEWKWHAASKSTGVFDENIAILRALLKALQSLASADASSNLSLEEIAHASLEDFYAQQEKKKTEASAMNSAIATSVGDSDLVEEICSATPTDGISGRNRVSSDSTSTNFDAFMARLEQQTCVSSTTNKADGLEADNIPVSSRSKSEGGDEKMLDSATSSTVTDSGPSYPKSFKDVVDFIQKGETVPGIRDIEEKLSIDASELLRDRVKAGEATASKPWETLRV